MAKSASSNPSAGFTHRNAMELVSGAAVLRNVPWTVPGSSFGLVGRILNVVTWARVSAKNRPATCVNSSVSCFLCSGFAILHGWPTAARGWFDRATAATKLVDGQIIFLDRLDAHLLWH